MEGATLKDGRQARSLIRIVAALAAHTELSFTAAGGPAVRQAAQRLFEYPHTAVEDLLAGHFAQTARRCTEFPVVLVAQDTTFFACQQAQVEGLGRLHKHSKSGGLLGHSALALSEAGAPLGLLALQLWDACASPHTQSVRYGNHFCVSGILKSLNEILDRVLQARLRGWVRFPGRLQLRENPGGSLNPARIRGQGHRGVKVQ